MLKHSTIIAFGLFTLPLTADHIRFDNGDAFAGDILHFTKDTLFLKTPHSVEPLEILPARVATLFFDQKKDASSPPSELHILKLSNGDTLSGLFQSLDENNLTFKTHYAEILTIPRSHISALYFNKKADKILYTGPRGLSGWTVNNGWDFENGTFFSTGQGSIARNLDLPDQFTVSASFTWKDKPNLRLYICASHPNDKERKTSSYYLTLNSGGLAFHRYDPEGHSSYARLIQLDDKKAAISSLKGTIELRINRRNAKVTLFYNGKSMGTFRDPSGVSPKGSYVIIDSNTSSHQANVLEQIEVRAWDANSDQYHSEKPKSDDTDSLTTSKGERFSGKILNYNPTTSSFILNHPHTDKPVSIANSDCSVIHFKKIDSKTPSATSTVNLNSGGFLTLTPSALDQNGFLTAIHPLIGNITLKRSAIQKISRINPAKK